MGKLGTTGVLLALLGVVRAQNSVVCTPTGNGNFHDFSSDLLDESATIDFADYQGKIKLVVNTASF
jgi:hypothetical protein